MLETLGAIVTLGSMPGTALSQASDRHQIEDDQAFIAKQIDAAQAQDGPQSAELIPPLTELAKLYETEGEHALATAALEQARHIVRVNYGLYTLDQAPLIDRALESEDHTLVEFANLAMVQALEEELYDLAERHPADLRTVEIHRGIAERRINLLRSFVAGESPEGQSRLFSIEGNDVVSDLVSGAQIHYADAAAVLLRNGLYLSDELRELEMEIIRSGDLIRQRNAPNAPSAVPGTRRMDYLELGALRTFGEGEKKYGGKDVTATEGLQTRTNTLWDLAPGGSHDADKRRRRVSYIDSRYLIAREGYRRLIAYADTAPHSAADESAWPHSVEAHVGHADWD